MSYLSFDYSIFYPDIQDAAKKYKTVYPSLQARRICRFSCFQNFPPEPLCLDPEDELCVLVPPLLWWLRLLPLLLEGGM